MTEQKRIRDFLREGTAVDVDQRTRTRTALVYMPGEELFAGSRCAYQKDRHATLRVILLLVTQAAEHDRLTVADQNLRNGLAGRDHRRVELHLGGRLIDLLLDQ